MKKKTLATKIGAALMSAVLAGSMAACGNDGASQGDSSQEDTSLDGSQSESGNQDSGESSGDSGENGGDASADASGSEDAGDGEASGDGENQAGGAVVLHEPKDLGGHWNAPEKYLTNEEPWYRGFYTEATNIDLGAIMRGEDEEGYGLLLRDIDAIAEQIAILQEADVPILFRPLHEASGGWFWWGAAGPEGYIELWKLVFQRMTEYHKLNNIIWVWNGQDGDWYPGDEYVDIIGEDIYPGKQVYLSQSGKFSQAVEYADSPKPIALTENGCLFDPELAFRDQAPWLWFCTWSGEFVVKNNLPLLSEEYTEEAMVRKVYEDERVITLDELPDWKQY